MAAYALGAHEAGLAGVAVEDNGLMTAVAARHLTASAADAQFFVELRIDDGVAIQLLRLQELRQQFSHEEVQRG